MQNPEPQAAEEAASSVGSWALVAATAVVTVTSLGFLAALGTPPGADYSAERTVSWFRDHRKNVRWAIWFLTVGRPFSDNVRVASPPASGTTPRYISHRSPRIHCPARRAIVVLGRPGASRGSARASRSSLHLRCGRDVWAGLHGDDHHDDRASHAACLTRPLRLSSVAGCPGCCRLR